MSQKVEKAHTFLDPSPLSIWTFLKLGENWNFFGRHKKILNFGPPPLGKKTLKHLKLPKKTLKSLHLHLHFRKTWKFGLPFLLSNSHNFEFWTFWFWVLTLLPPPSFGLFALFVTFLVAKQAISSYKSQTIWLTHSQTFSYICQYLSITANICQ